MVLREPCDDFVVTWGPIIIPMLEKKETADAICLAIKFCGGGDPGPVCRLNNPPANLEREKASILAVQKHVSERETFLRRRIQRRQIRALETPWGWLLKRLEYTFNEHLPFDDFDNDTFSSIHEFRGTSWRGKDCNDFESSIRPGTTSKGRAAGTDWNCNGIFGSDNSGQSWEESLCSKTQQFGVACEEKTAIQFSIFNFDSISDF